jgi:hypothetical protein
MSEPSNQDFRPRQVETAEQRRLNEVRTRGIPWRKWGPYLSERQWGTVREDYSENGDAWNYFPHDHARSRAYRWGEDGLAGFSDEKQQLCFALALWNGVDPILKERLFGLTNSEGNHGEDVKEYYFYLDSTPTHSYMKYLYKYPQRGYPYNELVRTNQNRTRLETEFELLDTGAFSENRYFDVFVEYAKASPEHILILITVHNRGPESAMLHLLPTFWFRNTWSRDEKRSKPELRQLQPSGQQSVLQASHSELGDRFILFEELPPLVFTENETNMERICNTPNRSPYVKDAFHNYVIRGRTDAVNPQKIGTKAAAYYQLTIPAGKCQTVRLELADVLSVSPIVGLHPGNPLEAFDHLLEQRKREADEFYAPIIPPSLDEDQRNVLRQALAGMLWNKQYYFFDVDQWLGEHAYDPTQGSKKACPRNAQWFHMLNDDVISMPDKWEYPWYAAWDLAFHTIALAMVDLDFAKHQLDLMLQEVYLHPNGQIPAYEWNFGDVNPPVQAWATVHLYNIERARTGRGDIEFLKGAFQKLLLNFTWWVNRKDRDGRNVFEGGFLGLDNIGVFDRSSPLPTGGYLEQADGTAWMALFSQNMLQIALELADVDESYEAMAVKFVEHFFWIAGAMDRLGINPDEMWDEEDGFFYDVLRFPDGRAERIKVRSLVGLLPLCATTVIPEQITQRFPRLIQKIGKFVRKWPELVANLQNPETPGVGGRLLAILDEKKLRRVLARMLDEQRFLGPFGIRSLSHWHLDHPYIFAVNGDEYRVQYMPAESNNGMFGGNSNWRGPVWMPLNMLIVSALLQFYEYYGDAIRIECPTGSGHAMTLSEIADAISRRLCSIFLIDANGRRPVYGGSEVFQKDPYWRDLILFYEYFHGDNGAGLGASHQTGWTGLVAPLLQRSGSLKATQSRVEGRASFADAYQEVPSGGILP